MHSAAARPRAHDVGPRRLQQLPVFHASGTRRFARATTETAIDMRLERRRLNRQTRFFDCAHQVEAAARAVVLVAGGYVSRTGLQTKPAVNAGQKFFFFGGESISEQC